MVRENEIEIRTDKKLMLFCTAVKAPDGNVELISRNGKKEDHISVNSLLSQAYGKNVVVSIMQS